MKVENQDLQHQIKRLNSQQKNLLTKKEQELENIKKITEVQKENARGEGLKQLYDIRDRNEIMVVEANAVKEKALEGYRNKITDINQRLADEKLTLASEHERQIKNTTDYFNEKFKERYFEAEETSRDINLKVNTDLADMQDKSNDSIRDAAIDTSTAMEKMKHKSQLLKNQAENDHQVDMKTLEYANLKNTNDLKNDHQRKLALLDRLNTQQLEEKKRAYSSKGEAEENQSKNLIEQKQKTFIERFHALDEAHNKVLDRMNKVFSEEVNTLSNKLADEKKIRSTKADDPFYRLTKLEHEVEETPTEYIVSLKVPEHEKENYHLSARDRKIKISYSRRFEDRTDAKTGEVFKSLRSENINKELPVNSLLNHRKITQSYADGTIYFKVAKL